MASLVLKIRSVSQTDLIDNNKSCSIIGNCSILGTIEVIHE